MEGKHNEGGGRGGLLQVTFTGSGHGVPDMTLTCVAYKSRPLSTNTSSNQLFKKTLKRLKRNQKAKGFKMCIYMQTTCQS